MELEKIKKVVYEFDERKINKLLEQGWVILNTASGTLENGEPIINVLLGLPQQG